MNCLGALVVRDLKTGVVFNIGTGFTAADRLEMWKNRANLLDKIVTYEYLPIGVKDKPRHPCFKGFRIEADL
jgi:DNA ligase-1